MKFHFYSALSDLPAGVDSLWRESALDSFFLTPWWFETVIKAALDEGDRVALGVLRAADGRPLALLPARFTKWGPSILVSRALRGLTGIYSCLFRPIIADSADGGMVARALGVALGRALAASDIVHFDAMDAAWPLLIPFEQGLAEAGLRVMQYDHFGNWSEDIAGRSFAQYLSSRDGALREILRRKERAASRRRVSHRVITECQDVEAGLMVYDAVYARSWKKAEPYPLFQPALMRNAAREGALRLGLSLLGDQPVAAQLWIFWRGRATVLKLAHDSAYDGLSLGSLLTAKMIRHLIEQDSAIEIDFGRGDDAYKCRWARRRRQRIGLLAANPRSVTGFIVLAHQAIGGWLRAARGNWVGRAR